MIEKLQNLRRYQDVDSSGADSPPQEVKKVEVAFPEEPKKVDNPSLDINGKHKHKKNVGKNQPQLWTSQIG